MTAVMHDTRVEQRDLVAGRIVDRGMALLSHQGLPNDLATYVDATVGISWDATGDHFTFELVWLNGQTVKIERIDLDTGKGPYQVARAVLGSAQDMLIENCDRQLLAACTVAATSLRRAHSAWVEALMLLDSTF